MISNFQRATVGESPRKNPISSPALARGVGVIALALSSAILSSCSNVRGGSLADSGSNTRPDRTFGQFASIDRSFVEIAALNDARVLANARAALRTTGDPVIAEYARKSAASAQIEQSNLASFASEVEIALPATDGVAADATFGRLRGRSFDRAYLDADRTDRSRAIDAFRSEVNAGSQRTLAAYALDTLPSMERDQLLAQTDRAYLDNPQQYGELVPLRS